MSTLHRTIVRPIMTEKTSAAIRRVGEYTFEVGIRREQAAIRQAIERLFGVKVTGVWTRTCAASCARSGNGRAAAQLEEGDRQARAGDTIDVFEAKRIQMPVRQFKRSPRARASGRSRISRNHSDHAREIAARASQEIGRPRQSWAHRHAPPGWRPTSGCTGSSTSDGTSSASRARLREIEYDPNRSARIALIEYTTARSATSCIRGAWRRRHDRVRPWLGRADGQHAAAARDSARHRRAQRRVQGGEGGTDRRSAGTSVEVVAKEGEYVTVRLRSTEMRLVHGNCLATVGTVREREHELLSWARRARRGGWAAAEGSG